MSNPSAEKLVPGGWLAAGRDSNVMTVRQSRSSSGSHRKALRRFWRTGEKYMVGLHSNLRFADAAVAEYRKNSSCLKGAGQAGCHLQSGVRRHRANTMSNKFKSRLVAPTGGSKVTFHFLPELGGVAYSLQELVCSNGARRWIASNARHGRRHEVALAEFSR